MVLKTFITSLGVEIEFVITTYIFIQIQRINMVNQITFLIFIYQMKKL